MSDIRTDTLQKFVEKLGFICLQPYVWLEQGGELWKQLGAPCNRLGASEIPSAAGVASAYKSRAELWRIKKGLQQSLSNPMMDYGQEAEHYAILLLIKQLTGEVVVNEKEVFGQQCLFLWKPGRWILEDDERYACSPDGIFFDNFGVLDLLWQDVQERSNGQLKDHRWISNEWLIEIKCPYDGLPYDAPKNHHLAQILTQMHIMKIPRCLYVQYTPRHERPLHAYVVLYNRFAWEALKSRADEFLKYVESNVVPPRLRSKWHVPVLCLEVDDFPQSACEDSN